MNVAQAELGMLIQPVVDALCFKYGWLVGVISYIGILRVTFKPLIAAIEVAVKQTESKKDDELLEKFEKSSTYFWVMWILDLFSSVRIPGKVTVNPMLAKPETKPETK